VSLIEVSLGECRCPGTPHPDGDLLYLRPKLGLAAGVAIQQTVIDMAGNRSAPDITGLLSEAYLRYGVAEWNLVDETGKPLELTPETLREQVLDDFERATPAADRADELYMQATIGPLLPKAPSSLPTMPTNGSTSATNGNTPKPRKRSKRSSTITSPMGVTATTTDSPAGVSSSSAS
jgi:hypothetical protein